jgi:hypothetical protein
MPSKHRALSSKPSTPPKASHCTEEAWIIQQCGVLTAGRVTNAVEGY